MYVCVIFLVQTPILKAEFDRIAARQPAELLSMKRYIRTVCVDCTYSNTCKYISSKAGPVKVNWLGIVSIVCYMLLCNWGVK